MPKPSKELSGGDHLTLWLLNHHSQQYIQSPSQWIAHSQLSGITFDKADAKADKSTKQSHNAQKGANATFQMKHWAIAYYYYRLSLGEVKKEFVAQDIRELLLKDFPDIKIPVAKTIETRWLREEIKPK